MYVHFMVVGISYGPAMTELLQNLSWTYGGADLENRLLAKFDVACLEHDLKSMANCAKILAQVK